MKLPLKSFIDHRGANSKFYVDNEVKELSDYRGIHEAFYTQNKKGTIRAFHYQGKLMRKIVKPMNGSFNVRIVDLKEKVIYEYDNVNINSQPILVGEDQMLGYVALEEGSVMLYLGDEYFDAESNFGVNPFSYGVNWNTDIKDFVLSERDKELELIEEKFEAKKVL